MCLHLSANAVRILEDSDSNVLNNLHIIINRTSDLEGLIADLIKIFPEEDDEGNDAELIDLEVDGDRAFGTVLIGKTKDKIYFRKYDRNWTVCVEGEWKNRAFLQCLD